MCRIVTTCQQALGMIMKKIITPKVCTQLECLPLLVRSNTKFKQSLFYTPWGHHSVEQTPELVLVAHDLRGKLLLCRYTICKIQVTAIFVRANDKLGSEKPLDHLIKTCREVLASRCTSRNTPAFLLMGKIFR